MNLRNLLAPIGFFFYMFYRVFIYYTRRFTLVSIFVGILLIVILIKISVFPTYYNNSSNGKPYKTILIPRGISFKEISQILYDNKVLSHKNLFIFLGKISGYQNKIQAGMFQIPGGLHPWHLLKYLLNPKMAEIKVTLHEGIQVKDIAHILKEKLNVDSLRFMNLAWDSTFCHSLGVRVDNLEGYLLPETYFFHYSMDEIEIIEFLVKNTLGIFENDTVQYQLDQLGMDVHDVVTLASIVEGEVVIDSERTTVSSVYLNRLKRGWHLGADPTIQYIIPGPPRRLLNKDLEIDSPYNTYIYRGLPPGPINNPGKKSILAVIFPADTRYLYFVATGDGGHHFSRTAAEHAYWKEKFDRVRRDVRRQKRLNNN
jgi:UPF0755 protein